MDWSFLFRLYVLNVPFFFKCSSCFFVFLSVTKIFGVLAFLVWARGQEGERLKKERAGFDLFSYLRVRLYMLGLHLAKLAFFQSMTASLWFAFSTSFTFNLWIVEHYHECSFQLSLSSYPSLTCYESSWILIWCLYLCFSWTYIKLLRFCGKVTENSTVSLASIFAYEFSVKRNISMYQQTF